MIDDEGIVKFSLGCADGAGSETADGLLRIAEKSGRVTGYLAPAKDS